MLVHIKLINDDGITIVDTVSSMTQTFTYHVSLGCDIVLKDGTHFEGFEYKPKVSLPQRIANTNEGP